MRKSTLFLYLILTLLTVQVLRGLWELGFKRTVFAYCVWYIAILIESIMNSQRRLTVPGSLERAAASSRWRSAMMLLIFSALGLALASFVDHAIVLGFFGLGRAAIDAWRFWKDDDGGPWLKQKIRKAVTILVMRPTPVKVNR